MYKLEYIDGWDSHFHNLHPEVQKRIWKKIQQIKNGLKGRHLGYGLPFFVEEVGQNRICYISDDKNMIRSIHFAGDHKDYESWLKGFR